MATIKIISNPYQKKITFQRYNDYSNTWTDINIDNDSNSPLLRDNLVSSFFPFKVKDIVDEIIKAYHINNTVTNIVFEGTDDEYKELNELCCSEHYSDMVKLSKSDFYLENARDILPEINEVYEPKQTITEPSSMISISRAPSEMDALFISFSPSYISTLFSRSK